MTFDLQMGPVPRWIRLDICAKKIPQSVLVFKRDAHSRPWRTWPFHSDLQNPTNVSFGVDLRLNFQEKPSEHNLSDLMAQKPFTGLMKRSFQLFEKVYKSVASLFSKRLKMEQIFFVIYHNKATAAALSYIWDCMNQSELSNIWWRAEGSSRIQLLRIWRRIFSLFMDHKENACLCRSCQKMTNRRDSHKHIHRSK